METKYSVLLTSAFVRDINSEFKLSHTHMKIFDKFTVRFD